MSCRTNRAGETLNWDNETMNIWMRYNPRKLTDIVEAERARPRTVCEVIPGDGHGDNPPGLLVQPRPGPGLPRAELAPPRAHQHPQLTDNTGRCPISSPTEETSCVRHLVSDLSWASPGTGQWHGWAEERSALVTRERGLALDHKIQTWARNCPVMAPCHAGWHSLLNSYSQPLSKAFRLRMNWNGF